MQGRMPVLFNAADVCTLLYLQKKVPDILWKDYNLFVQTTSGTVQGQIWFH